MNFWEKRKWNSLLKGCDYQLAGKVLIQQFKDGVIKKELASLFDAYLENPCLETSVDIIKYAPDFILIFNECKPDGLYNRLGFFDKEDDRKE